MILFRLFGPVELRADDERELRSVVVQPKRLALLAYLAAAPGGRQRRDALLGVFWPELDSTHARGALNKSIHYLRRSLGEGVIESEGDEQLAVVAGGLWCDVTEFARALDDGRLADALTLYRGDLLQGFFLSDTPEFEHWLDREREHYRRQAATAAWSLAEQGEHDGNPAAAADWGRRACAILGDDEKAVQRLLEVLHRVGDRSGAIRLYEDFARRLAGEYGLDPSADTVELIAQIRTDDGGRRRAAPAAMPATSGDSGATTSHLEPSAPTADSPADAGSPGPFPGPAVDPAASPRRSLNPALRVALLAGAAALVAATAYLLLPQRSPAVPTPRVVVAPFDNLTGQPALQPLGNMAADWIIQGLAETGLVEVVPFTATLTSTRFVGGLIGEGDTAERARTLARETGARIVVSGAYYQQGDSLHLHARILDVEAGRVLHAFEPVSTSSAAPLAAVEMLRQRVMAGLAPHINPRIRAYATLIHATPSYDAYREYAEGVERFTASDWRGALAHFARASAHDSTFTLAAAAAALAYSNLGDYAAVDSLARAVSAQGARMAEYDRQALNAAVAWAHGDYATSLRAAQRLASLAPNTMPHAQVGRELLMVNRPREALRVFRELDPSRGELRDWFPFWNNLAIAHHLLGEYADEVKVARRMRAQFPDAAAAAHVEARALIARGRPRDATRVLEDQLVRLGSGTEAAALMRGVALELHAHGDSASARLLLKRSAAAYEAAASASENAAPALRRALGEALYLAGDHERARDVLAALAAERGDDISLTGRLGTIAAARGDRAEAERIDAWLAGLERPYLLGENTLWRARIAARLNNSERAVDLVRDAYAQGRTEWHVLHADPDLASLRANARFRALLRPKG